MSQIRTWLDGIGMTQYADLFEQNKIDTELLPDLTDSLLIDMGIVVLGHRLRLLKAIGELSEAQAVAEGATSLEPSDSLESPIAEAERRHLTIMFCDLVGSTALSRMLDPEDYRDVMRSYQEAAAGAIKRFEGFVAKYLGDGLLVYFGYPQAQEDAAERAVRAALSVIETVSKLKPRPGVRLQVRIGIATGIVVAGDLVGEGIREAAAVSGETPNLAARLQTMALPNTVVIADATRRLLGSLFRVKRLEARDLKGFTDPVPAWRIVGEARSQDRFEARMAGKRTPLVARQEEIELLLDRWQHAKSGEGQAVLLRGDPGIGKSRLLETLRDRADAHFILRYHCSPYFTNSSLHPFIMQLEHAAGFAPEDTTEIKLDKLEELLKLSSDRDSETAALFASLLSLPVERYPRLNLAPGRQTQRTMAALVDELVSLARHGTVLALFEDAHWIDPTSLDLLTLTIERLPQIRALLVVTFRPEFTPPWDEGDHVSICDLDRLSRDQCLEIAASVSADKDLPEDLLIKIVAKTDGVPLFVEELTKTVMESEMLTESGAAGVAGEPRSQPQIPTTLYDSLMARLDRMAPVKEIAQLGAAIGRDFDYGLISAVAPCSEPALQDALHHLVEAGLILPQRSTAKPSWTFKHALVQEAAYESMLKSRRQELHCAIAQALVNRFPEQASSAPELVAHHSTLAGDTQQAVTYWLAAGRKAWQRAAAKEALAHLSRGQALVETIEQTAVRDELELKLQSTLGVVHFAATSYAAPEARTALLRAYELCERVDDADLRVGVLYGIGAFQTMKGDIAAGHEAFEKLMESAVQSGQPRYLVYTHSMLAWSHYNRADYNTALLHADKLLALYTSEWSEGGARLSAADPKVISECFRAVALWALGFPDQASRTSEEVLDYARTLKDPYSLAYALNFAALQVPDLLGRRQLVLERSQEGVQLARELGYLFLEVFGTLWHARALSELGDPMMAINMKEEALRKCETLGVRYHDAHLTAHLAKMLVRAGRVKDALNTLDGVLDMIDASGERSQEPEVHLAIGDVLRASGQKSWPESERAYSQALDVARAQHAKSWELRSAIALARLSKDQNRTREYEKLLAQTFAQFVEGFETADLIEAKDLLRQMR